MSHVSKDPGILDRLAAERAGEEKIRALTVQLADLRQRLDESGEKNSAGSIFSKLLSPRLPSAGAGGAGGTAVGDSTSFLVPVKGGMDKDCSDRYGTAVMRPLYSHK